MSMLKGTRMRTTCVSGVFAVGLALAGAITAGGCFHFEDDCELAHDCPTGSTGTSGTSTSSSSGTGGMPPGCEGDPTKDATLVREECGVFVAASAAVGGKGTKGSPYQSFAEAAGASDTKRIYACAEHPGALG